MSFSGKYSDVIQPEKLDKLSVSIFLNELIDADGGVAANITYSLALLGEKSVLLGAVGPDGTVYLERLARLGVDITAVHESALPTATFNVITDAAENQLGGFYPGAMSDSASLSFEAWKNQNPICVVSPHDPAGMRRQVQECADWDLRLCYDVGQQVTNLGADDLRAGVEAAEVLILNEYELGVLVAKTGLSEAEIKSRVPVVITTHGKHGSTAEGAQIPEPVRAGIVQPSKVKDPTGAGDAYRAGFLFGWQRDYKWLDCMQLGATCATFAIEGKGPQGHVFTLAEVAARYEASFGKPLPAQA